MSAIGTKRTSLVALHMPAFGGKADMARLSGAAEWTLRTAVGHLKKAETLSW